MAEPLVEIRTEHTALDEPFKSTTDIIIGGQIVFRSSHIGLHEEDETQPSRLKQLVLDALRQFGVVASSGPTGAQG